MQSTVGTAKQDTVDQFCAPCVVILVFVASPGAWLVTTNSCRDCLNVPISELSRKQSAEALYLSAYLGKYSCTPGLSYCTRTEQSSRLPEMATRRQHGSCQAQQDLNRKNSQHAQIYAWGAAAWVNQSRRCVHPDSTSLPLDNPGEAVVSLHWSWRCPVACVWCGGLNTDCVSSAENDQYSFERICHEC